MLCSMCSAIIILYSFFSQVVKKLPGIRKYVDPQNYASPDAALKDFALEIPSHQLRLDEVIGGGEICKLRYFKKLMVPVY